MQRPRILIPLASYNELTPQKYGINKTYLHAIVKAGGEPLCVARMNEERLNDLLSIVDGILLIGGDDINPERYGQKNSGLSKNVDVKRDELELAVVRIAVEKKIPLLGICRGMQVMNVALGGTLFQDVAAEMDEAIIHDHHYHDGELAVRSYLAHEIVLEKSTLLHRIAQKETLKVNSLHHQGIKTLGKNLVASAHATDGLIEAIELPDHPCALGIEWHPEELTDETSQKIFQSFIESTRGT